MARTEAKSSKAEGLRNRAMEQGTIEESTGSGGGRMNAMNESTGSVCDSSEGLKPERPKLQEI